MEVHLITTGTMEFHGLAHALARLFPSHDFAVVDRTGNGDHFEGITSTPLSGAVPSGVRENTDVIIAEAASLAAAMARSRRDGLVFIVDDLELANQGDPASVTSVVGEAVAEHLGRLTVVGNQALTRAALRARVSFHLAAPMIEAWLFADQHGLVNAGVTGERPAHLGCGTALEDFLVTDAGFLQDDCSNCEKWATLLQGGRTLTRSKRKANCPEWCKGDRSVNGRHPKRYLAWLCRDSTQKKCSTYREHDGVTPSARTGATALAQLDWSRVRLGEVHMPFLNALVEDLADALGEPCPLPGDAVLASETSRKVHPPAVLRNL